MILLGISYYLPALVAEELSDTQVQVEHSKEYVIIKTAADRNDCRGALLVVLCAIRKAENGGPGLEFGVIHPDAKGTDLDTQAGWAAATVVKNYSRWVEADRPGEGIPGFIEFLGERYAPIGASELNKNWITNVQFWYAKFREDLTLMEKINEN